MTITVTGANPTLVTAASHTRTTNATGVTDGRPDCPAGRNL
jgi:hypothetical protein